MHSRSKNTSKPHRRTTGSPGILCLVWLSSTLLALTGCAETKADNGSESNQPPPPAEVGFIEIERRNVNRINQLPGRVVAFAVAEAEGNEVISIPQKSATLQPDGQRSV